MDRFALRGELGPVGFGQVVGGRGWSRRRGTGRRWKDGVVLGGAKRTQGRGRATEEGILRRRAQLLEMQTTIINVSYIHISYSYFVLLNHIK